MNVGVTVVKIGGSLFTQPNFVPRLIVKVEQLAALYSPVHLVLVTGGGPLVESLRSIDSVNTLPAAHAHWTAIRLMDVNSELLQQWWPQLPCVACLTELRVRCQQTGITLFRVEEFLCHHEQQLPGTQLEVGWEVTSDSIAARISQVLGAERLILLKSIPAEWLGNWSEAAADGVVDKFFPRIAIQLGEVQIQSL